MAEPGTLRGELERGWARFRGLRWRWKASIIGGVVLVFMAVIGSIGGSNDQPSKASPDKTEQATNTPKATDTPKPGATATQPPSATAAGGSTTAAGPSNTTAATSTNTAVAASTATPVPATSTPVPATATNTPIPSDGHTWYTSSASNATRYYCDLDPEWRDLSASNLRSYSSEAALKAVWGSSRTKFPGSNC